MKNETEIAYQNKDVIAKIFGDRMIGKPLSMFGLDSSLRVTDIRPTNLPVLKANELRMDNVFELEDGSVAILDYESTYKKDNFFKYGLYVLHVARRYYEEGKEPDIHMMVLYTADIEEAPSDFHRTACDLRVESAFLVGVDSEEWMNTVRAGVEHQEISDELLMHLVLLPLTYKGDQEKQEAIRECVDLARKIENQGEQIFVLAGILTLTDKMISKEMREQIKEVLNMTQVGKMIYDDGRAKGREEEREEMIVNMFREGVSYEQIVRAVQGKMPDSRVRELQKMAQ